MDPVFDKVLRPWRLDSWKSEGGWYHHLPSGSSERWRSVDFLGSGSFGEVWQEQCVSGPSQNAVRAVKRIRKQETQFSKSSIRELEALITFSQPAYQNHFVRFLGWFEDPTELYISMEFIQHGNLQQYIKRRLFPEPEAALVITQVAQALRYMHQNNFVHRDLKPANILVAEIGPQWHVKVADFGISRQMNGTSTATCGIGTQGYMAPELIKSSNYTFAVDVWALGAVAFCMLTGSLPFESSEQLMAYRKNQTLFPVGALGNSSGFCMGFVQNSMAAKPKRRLTVEQVLAHEWLTIHTDAKQSPSISPTTPGTSTWGFISSHNTWSSDTYNGTASVHEPVRTAASKSSPQNTGPSGTTAMSAYSPVGLQPRSLSPPTVPAPTKAQAREFVSPYIQQASVPPHFVGTVQPEIPRTNTMMSIGDWPTLRPEIPRTNTPSSIASRHTVDSRSTSGTLTSDSPTPFSPLPPPVAQRMAQYPSKTSIKTGSCWGCKTCGKTFETHDNMIRHVQVNYHLPGTEIKVPKIAPAKPEPWFRAESPGISMPEESNPYLSCITCKQSFEKREYLMRHVKMFGHTPKVQVDSWLTCFACGQPFSGRSQLDEHLARTGHARSPSPGPGPSPRTEAYTWDEGPRRKDTRERSPEHDCCCSNSEDGADARSTYRQSPAYMPSLPSVPSVPQTSFWQPQQVFSTLSHTRPQLY